MSTTARLAALERRATTRSVAIKDGSTRAQYGRYRDDPLGFIRDVLRADLTPQQEDVVTAGMDGPRRVLVSSGNSVGKTYVGACLTLWGFYARDGLVLTTAPSERQVIDLLWREVRTLHARAGLPNNWVGPVLPRLQASHDRFAHGFTAKDATGFHGRHHPGGLIVIFDEAEGIAPEFWQSLKTMLDRNSHFWGFYNPTEVGSAAHLREDEADQHGTFSRRTLSCLAHPNITAGLNNAPLPVPGAIDLEQLRSMLLEDSTVLGPSEERLPTDVELAGVWYRPGPVAEARCLGRRATTATTGVWSENRWESVLATRHDIQPSWPVAIGCDVGRYGNDRTAIYVRKGFCALHCEHHAKRSLKWTGDRLRELCHEFADRHNVRERIPCLIDEGGVGGGLVDHPDGYRFIGVNASCKPRNPVRYWDTRAELWFTTREMAEQGALDVSRLPPASLAQLKRELLAARYKVHDGTDRNKVLSKDSMKAILGRSPDLADAFNLTYYPPPVEVR